MGWTCQSSITKQQLVSELIQSSWWGEEFIVVNHALRGGTLYMCVEQTARKVAFIAVYRIEVHGGEICYKDMCDSMGPCYYDCPIKFIDWADNHEHGAPKSFAEEWRQKVRDMAKAQSPKNRIQFVPGMVLEHCGGQYELVRELAPRQGWTVIDKSDGEIYRMPLKFMNKSTVVTNERPEKDSTFQLQIAL